MRICFIYNSVFRHGGVQRVVATLANALSENNEVSILCNEKIDIEKNFYGIDLNKVNVYYKNILNNNSNYKINNISRKIIIAISNVAPILLTDKIINMYYSKKTKENFIKFINEQNYDVVIGCMMPFNLLLGVVNKRLNCKTIAWENNSYDTYFPYEKFNIKSLKNLYGRIISKVNKFVVLTQNDKTKYMKIFKIEPMVIPNPLSVSSIKKSKCDNKVILYAGRIDETKGTDMLIDIFEKFSKKNPDWILNIVGEGLLLDSIKSKIKDKKLNNKIHIYPFTENIQEFYNKSSIYTCTSRHESFGLSVLEAMDCGVPVISFSTSGPSEIVIDKKTGIIVDKFNIDKYVEALDKIANNDKFRKQLSKNAIQRSKEYNIYNIILRWNEILN